jgi:chromosome segregation ATPase
MFFKMFKMGALVAGGALLAGGILFGSELSSYLRSSARSIRVAVKDNVPVEFELRRARDLLDQIGPEMHNSVRAIAEQEVEAGMLKRDIEDAKLALAEETNRVQKLRDGVAGTQSSFTVGDMSFSRTQVAQELARRFNNLRAAQASLAAKQLLLENRQKSLVAAQDALASAKSQRATLESQIEGLEAQYKLVQATSQSAASPARFDHSKLAQAKQVIGGIRKQLEVAERVLAHEAKFTPSLPGDVLDEKDLVAQVDAYVNGGGGNGGSAVTANRSAEPRIAQ